MRVNYILIVCAAVFATASALPAENDVVEKRGAPNSDWRRGAPNSDWKRGAPNSDWKRGAPNSDWKRGAPNSDWKRED